MSPSVNVRFILCGLSGITTGLAHQPYIPGFIAWISLLPFIYSLNSFTTLRRSIIGGWVFGLFYVSIIIYWLSQNIGTSQTIAWITLVVASLFLALNYIIISGLYYIIRKGVPWGKTWLLAIIWTAVEFARSFGILGFPWISLGNTQSAYLLPIQIAEFTSIYGLSFWLVMINSSLYKLIEMKRFREGLVFSIVFILPFLCGYMLMDNIPLQGSSLKVGIIQPNIHLNEKWGRDPLHNVRKIMELSEKAVDGGVQLLIWPETAVTTFMKLGSKMQDLLNDFLKKHKNVHLLTGIPEVVDDSGMKLYYNSIGQFSNTGELDIYRKIHPVPFAEHIPMASIFPVLKKLKLGQANWEIGEDFTVFETMDQKYSGVICFESTFPDLVREFVKNGAEFLTVLVNDGWYETAPEPQQHAVQSIFRAVENRRFILRCANTGISMVIEPSGRILEQTNLNEEQVIITEIHPSDELTFFAKNGNIFSWFMVIISIILFGVSLKIGSF